MSTRQVSALRATANLVEYAEITGGLYITVHDCGKIDVQVAGEGEPIVRVLAFAQLCSALDVDHRRRTTGGDPWRIADGEFEGHPVHAYVPLTLAEQASLDGLAVTLSAAEDVA